MAEDIIFEDVENYRNSSGTGLNVKQIVLTQYQKCLEAMSKELNRASKKEIITHEGVITKVTDNECKIFLNTVEALYITVNPNLKAESKHLKEQIAAYNRVLEDYNKWQIDEVNKRKLSTTHSINQEMLVDLERRYVEQKDGWSIELAKAKLELISYLLHELNWYDIRIMD